MKDTENADAGTTDQGSNVPATVALIVLTLALYVFYLFRSKNTKKEDPDGRFLLRRSPRGAATAQGRDPYTSCPSPDCVRCQKYEIVKAEAREKLTRFRELCGNAGLDRISASLDDLKSLPTDPLQNPNVLYVPGLRCRPFWDGSEFPHETNLLERQWSYINGEFEAVCGGGDDGWSRNSTASGVWSVFYLYNQGNRVSKNCRRCPRTAALVDSLASFMKSNVFGNALFSVLHPATVVAEHCGPCNTRIRCHLGLSVPEKTSISVGGVTKNHNLGCCTYFDDSFVHGSVNSSTSPRSVFLLDFWHPDLTMKERDSLNYVFSSS